MSQTYKLDPDFLKGRGAWKVKKRLSQKIRVLGKSRQWQRIWNQQP